METRLLTRNTLSTYLPQVSVADLSPLAAAYYLGRLLNARNWLQAQHIFHDPDTLVDPRACHPTIERLAVVAVADHLRIDRLHKRLQEDEHFWLEWLSCDGPELFHEHLAERQHLDEGSLVGDLDDLLGYLRQLMRPFAFMAVKFGATFDQGVRRVRLLDGESIKSLVPTGHSSAPRFDETWWAELRGYAPTVGCNHLLEKYTIDFGAPGNYTSCIRALDADIIRELSAFPRILLDRSISLTQSECGRITNLDRDRISKAVSQGKLASNGRARQESRIEFGALLQYCCDTERPIDFQALREVLEMPSNRALKQAQQELEATKPDRADLD